MPCFPLRLSLAIGCCGALLAEAQTGARPSPSPTIAHTPTPAAQSALDGAEVEQALAIIQRRYLDPRQVTGPELNRATLDGLLMRLKGGVILVSSPTPSPTPAPFYREILDGHIGYLRPSDLSQSQLQELDTTLRSFAGKNVDAIILDLRATPQSSDYAMAAEFASRFVAKGKPLFSLARPASTPAREFSSKQDPLYSGLTIVLVDKETSGAAEVLAGAIRLQHRAIAIGETTAGGGIEYAEETLRSGKLLRIAVAEAILPDQRPCFPKGLEPDLEIAFPADQKRQIFQESLTKGMAAYIFESDHPHLNEAALLAGTNPELDAIPARRSRPGEKPPLHDPVVQRAVDMVTSIGVYEKQPGRPP
jgi:hypothetical protein